MKHLIITFLVCTTFIGQALSQDMSVNNEYIKKVNRIFTVVDKQPKFPGGTKALDLHFKKYLKLPRTIKDNDAKVSLSFVVERDGSLTNIRVIKKIKPGLYDSEVLQAFRKSPKWRPGVKNGKLVRVAHAISIDLSAIR